ncbi:MAG: flagellar motor switch protein FliN [Thermodesulfobacteriota bacterium]|nr:flagellar motor switch protein FliN [Thermodesulfobacteriota bacterium]
MATIDVNKENIDINTDDKDKVQAKKEKPYEFSDLNETSAGKQNGNMDFILDIPLEITVELGRTQMLINDLLKLGQGSVLELTKSAGETMEILANKKLIARGEVVVLNEKYGIRLTEIISPIERRERMQ